MATEIYGSLVINATTPVKQFPQFAHEDTLSGQHTTSKFRGCYETLVVGTECLTTSMAIPQRNKYLNITTVVTGCPDNATQVNHSLIHRLTELDSRFEASRQLYKLNKAELEVYAETGSPFAAVINNTAEHANLSLMSHGVDLDILGVYDTVNSSIRLAWTTDPQFVSDVKAVDYTRYVFYRFPTLIDRPLFVYTQAVCSKWLHWARDFKGPDGILKTFNALENFLYKDPDRATLMP